VWRPPRWRQKTKCHKHTGKYECRKYMGPTLQRDMLHLISVLPLPHKVYYNISPATWGWQLWRHNSGSVQPLHCNSCLNLKWMFSFKVLWKTWIQKKILHWRLVTKNMWEGYTFSTQDVSMPLAPFQNTVHVKYATNNNLQYNYIMYQTLFHNLGVNASSQNLMEKLRVR